MAPRNWDDEEEDVSAPGSPVISAAGPRRKFDDEEDEGDVLDSWDADDSEVEHEKAAKAAASKIAEAAKPKTSKAERIAKLKAQRAAELTAIDDVLPDENEAERRARLRRSEQEADLAHAEDLFGDIGINPNRTAKIKGADVTVDAKDPSSTVDLTKLALFNPTTKQQFEALRNTLVPLLNMSNKKPHYNLFLQEFVKQISRELPSDQIKKVASSLTALSNEKLREEKAVEKGGKKTKAAKTKVSINTNRPGGVDTSIYDDDAFGDDDFM